MDLVDHDHVVQAFPTYSSNDAFGITVLPWRLKACWSVPNSHRTNAPLEDAADWIENMIGLEPEVGVTRVVMHSIAFQYFSRDTQKRVSDHLVQMGSNARSDAPLAWLRMEGLGKSKAGIPLTLTTWPDGTEREIAVADGHGAWLEWC